MKIRNLVIATVAAFAAAFTTTYALGATTATPQVLAFTSTNPVPAYVGDSYQVIVQSTGNITTDTNRITFHISPATCTIGPVTLIGQISPITQSDGTPVPSTVPVGSSLTLSASVVEEARANITLVHPGTCTISANQPAGAGYSAAVVKRQVFTVVKAP